MGKQCFVTSFETELTSFARATTPSRVLSAEKVVKRLTSMSRSDTVDQRDSRQDHDV